MKKSRLFTIGKLFLFVTILGFLIEIISPYITGKTEALVSILIIVGGITGFFEYSRFWLWPIAIFLGPLIAIILRMFSHLIIGQPILEDFFSLIVAFYLYLIPTSIGSSIGAGLRYVTEKSGLFTTGKLNLSKINNLKFYVFLFSILPGIILWIFSESITGHIELWDANFTYSMLPFMIIAFVAGFLIPKPFWLWTALIYISQIVGVILATLIYGHPSDLAMLPLGAFVMLIYSAPILMASLFGAGLRYVTNRIHKKIK